MDSSALEMFKSLLDSYLIFLISKSYPYWQKYVNGINLTVLGCDPTQDDECPIQTEQNKLYTAIKSNDVCLQNN